MHQLAAFLAVLLLVCAQPVNAQEAAAPADTRLNAFACEALPAPLRVDVEVLDNAERDLRFRDGFVARLRSAGVEVADNASLIMTLELRKVVEFERREGGELFELRAGQENEDIGREGDLFMRGNVWSNRSDSVLGGRKRDPGQLSVDQLQITASVNRRDDGRCLWRGEVQHELDGEDADDAMQRLLPLLADALGKTVRDQPVKLRR